MRLCVPLSRTTARTAQHEKVMAIKDEHWFCTKCHIIICQKTDKKASLRRLKTVTNALWILWVAASRQCYTGGSKRTIKAHPRSLPVVLQYRLTSQDLERRQRAHPCSWPFRKYGGGWGEGGGLLLACIPLSRLHTSSSTSSIWQQSSACSVLNTALSNRLKKNFC